MKKIEVTNNLNSDFTERYSRILIESMEDKDELHFVYWDKKYTIKCDSSTYPHLYKVIRDLTGEYMESNNLTHEGLYLVSHNMMGQETTYFMEYKYMCINECYTKDIDITPAPYKEKLNKCISNTL